MLDVVSMWMGSVAPQQLTRDWRDWVGLGARLVLGISLSVAGLLKVGRLQANVAQVELFQLPIPDPVVTLIGYAQPFVEIAVGLMLIIGLFTRINAVLGTLSMVAFIAGIIWAWAHGLRIDCGCFTLGGELGAEEQTRYLQDIARDLGLMACGLWLWLRPASVLASDTWLLRPVAAVDDFDHDEPRGDPTPSYLTSHTGR